MRLMQLKALVFPAPLGPISAKSSAAPTLNDKRSNTVRPPKRRLRSSTSSSAIPPPAAAVLLHLPIAAAGAAAGAAQVEFLDVGVALQPRRIAVEHGATVLQDIGIVDDFQRHCRALLDQHHGDAEPALDLDKPRHEVVHHHGRQTQRQLIYEQELRLAHERGSDRQHLPLPARQQSSQAKPQLAKFREELDD